MAIALKPCNTCRGATTLSQLEKVAGEGGELKVTVLGMPALKCAKGHAGPVHPDFLLWLLGELKQREATLPGGEEKGLLMFKKYLCACGRELPAQAAARRSFDFELAYPDAAPFRAGFEAPVYACPGCGSEQLRSRAEAKKQVSLAMVQICDRAGFPHSG